MPKIHVLSSETINRIAAGEVVERPVNIVKELVENSIDAGASAISVEIKDGGISMVRVTDNGCGIDPEEITTAFRRHATSKITDEKDLEKLVTLGFRGEALSSIAAVSQVEMITKTKSNLTGIRAANDVFADISGAASLQTTDVIPLSVSEVGAPDGTTVIVRNLFYNVPVRRKFLKTPQTEAGYITDMIEHFALSHPDISFHYRVNGQEKLHTTGNGNEKELIYRIYGREMSSSVIPITAENDSFKISGYLGRPEFSRSSRNYEVFFVNGRILKSDILSKALEEGYGTDLMQHRFPFTIMHIDLMPDAIDVNVHPSKMEIRFTDPKELYEFIRESVDKKLHKVELIPKADLNTASETKAIEKAEERERTMASRLEPHLEPFEKRTEETTAPASVKEEPTVYKTDDFVFEDITEKEETQKTVFEQVSFIREPEASDSSKNTEEAEYHILSQENTERFKLIGQIFNTYWLIEFEDQLLMIDQHAAHEKVNFERLMKRMERSQNGDSYSQLLAPPIVVDLTGKEEGVFLQYQSYFEKLGFEAEEFGSGSYAIRAIPMELYANEPEALFKEIIDEMLNEKIGGTPSAILYKIASMSCKAAVKGNMSLRTEEAKELINELLSLDNPYHCPHGRPTMIVMSRQEIEKKFKRIV